MKLKHLLFILAAGVGTTAAFAQDDAQNAKKIRERVKELITERCSLCHGARGDAASGTFPRLAAQHPAYIVKQLRDFRDGRRRGTAMNEMAKDLGEEEIAGLAVHFSTQKAGSRKSLDSDLVAVGSYIFNKGNEYSGVPACASCHGADGHGTIQLPRLAGQHPSYLETQLVDFNKRDRTNDNAIMHTIASKMTMLEIKAVTAYIGGLE